MVRFLNSNVRIGRQKIHSWNSFSGFRSAKKPKCNHDTDTLMCIVEIASFYLHKPFGFLKLFLCKLPHMWCCLLEVAYAAKAIPDLFGRDHLLLNMLAYLHNSRFFQRWYGGFTRYGTRCTYDIPNCIFSVTQHQRPKPAQVEWQRYFSRLRWHFDSNQPTNDEGLSTQTFFPPVDEPHFRYCWKSIEFIMREREGAIRWFVLHVMHVDIRRICSTNYICGDFTKELSSTIISWRFSMEIADVCNGT